MTRFAGARPLTRSAAIAQRARRVVWRGGPEAQRPDRLREYGFPSFLARGEGCKIWDVDGNVYTDYLMSWGSILLGHAHEGILRAAGEQMHLGTLFNLTSEREVELAERLVDLIPGAEQVRFVASGSEATSAAVRIARAATGREKIIRYGYHGWHDWALAQFPRGIPQATLDQVLPLRYNDLDHLATLFAEHPQEIACILMEPVKDELPQEGFLEGVRRAADDHGALLIFDEVKTGFRLAPGGAQSYFDVIPDLCLFSKTIANGFPLAALAAREAVLERAEGAWISGTFHGWLPAVAAAHATLDTLETGEVTAKVWRHGELLMRGVAEIMASHGLEARLRGLPPMAQLHYPEEEEEIFHAFFTRMIERGQYLHPRHLWYTSDAHETEDIERTLDIMETVVRELT